MSAERFESVLSAIQVRPGRLATGDAGRTGRHAQELERGTARSLTLSTGPSSYLARSFLTITFDIADLWRHADRRRRQTLGLGDNKPQAR